MADPTPPPARPRAGRWELVVALALAVTTVTGALVTYLAVQRESAAADADRQAVIETILVEQRRSGAGTQTYAYGSLAARYRRLLAEADAVADTDPARAARNRQVAAGLAAQTGIYEFLTGAGAASRFDHAARLEAALHYGDGLTVPDDQPARTAATADAHRTASGRLALAAVGTLAVVVLLTLARVVRRRVVRLSLLGAAALGWLTAVGLAVAQVG
jgi:hypothetical protein